MKCSPRAAMTPLRPHCKSMTTTSVARVHVETLLVVVEKRHFDHDHFPLLELCFSAHPSIIRVLVNVDVDVPAGRRSSSSSDRSSTENWVVT